jgi:hypothetical protein
VPLEAIAKDADVGIGTLYMRAHARRTRPRAKKTPRAGTGVILPAHLTSPRDFPTPLRSLIDQHEDVPVDQRGESARCH